MTARGSYTLLIEHGPSAGQRILLRDTAPMTIGRHADNTIVLNDQRLSRHHARLTFRDGALSITDLESANGTRVNGEPLVGERQIGPGDTLDLGGLLLRIEASGQAPTASVLPPHSASTQLGTPDLGLAQSPGAPLLPPIPIDMIPPTPARRSTSSRTPLIIGALGAAFLALCFCGGLLGLAAFSGDDDDNAASGGVPTSIPTLAPRSGGAVNTPTPLPRNSGAGNVPIVSPPGNAAGGGSTAPQPGNGAGQPTNRPAQQTGGGVARGDYLCQAFTTVGLATVGGIHIITDTLLTYSTDDKPLPGATQYTYTYDSTTGAIRFIGGPYDGRQGTYSTAKKHIQVSPSVGCAWQR